MAHMGSLAPIPVLYRDADVVAVLKPEGMAAVGEEKDDPHCLSACLARELGLRIWPVHRLDKDVSGVILYALSATAHRFLNRAFEQRQVDKCYLAVVHGVVETKAGVIDHPIREFGSGRMGVDDVRGKPAQTNFRVLACTASHTLLEVRPHTGRRHQIRVHLYHLGHPIVGDDRYGKGARLGNSPRLMLHAAGVALDLPSGKRLDLRDVPSPTFEAELAQLGFPLETLRLVLT
jgi:tRNA pseudouridine32 synthase/23S rRNA pseudouridine746 synthase